MTHRHECVCSYLCDQSVVTHFTEPRALLLSWNGIRVWAWRQYFSLCPSSLRVSLLRQQSSSNTSWKPRHTDCETLWAKLRLHARCSWRKCLHGVLVLFLLLFVSFFLFRSLSIAFLFLFYFITVAVAFKMYTNIKSTVTAIPLARN